MWLLTLQASTQEDPDDSDEEVQFSETETIDRVLGHFSGYAADPPRWVGVRHTLRSICRFPLFRLRLGHSNPCTGTVC